MNRIELSFAECTPAHVAGYEVFYRVLGAAGPLINAGIFYNSPAVFFDPANLPGTQYEGYIRSVSADNNCTLIFWTTDDGSSGSSSSGCDNMLIWTHINETDVANPFDSNFTIRINGVEVVNVDENQNDIICVNIGDFIQVVEREFYIGPGLSSAQHSIDITGPYTNHVSDLISASLSFYVTPGVFVIVGRSYRGS